MRKNLKKYIILGAAPLAGTVIAGIIFRQWLVHTIESNVAMNMKILISMFIGAALMYWRLWQMWREDKALIRFKQTVQSAGKGEDPDDKAARSRKMMEVLSSKAYAHLDIRKVLEPVAATGGHIRSRVDQAAIEAEIHGMKAEMESRWEFPNFFVGFMVALGLLGTFIGLLETLVGTSELIGAFGGKGNMDEAIAKLVSGLQKPLAGMGTAFAASMFGLVGSLVLGMTMMAVRSCGSALMANVHETILQFTERSGPNAAASAAVSENYLANAMADMLDVQREAQDTFNRSLQTSLAVSAKTESVLAKLDALTHAVSAQADAAKRTNDLLHVGPRMRELAEQQLAEHKAIVAGLHAQTQAMDTLHQSMTAIDRRLGTQNDGAAREREVLRSAMGTITESQNATRAMLVSRIEDEREARQDQLREMQTLRQSTIDTNATIAGWGSGLGHLQQLGADQLLSIERQAMALDQMIGAIEGLTRTLSTGMEQTSRDSQAARNAQIDVAKQLSGLGTVLRLNNEQVTEHITQLADSNVQNSQMAGLVAEEVRVLKRGIGREVRKELREVVAQIKGTGAAVVDD